MLRTPEDVPDGVELAELVSEQDMGIFRLGLKKIGASDAILAKIKGLEKLSMNGGKFLAASLQITHRMYVVQLVGLYEEIDAIRKVLEDDRNETDSTKKLSIDDKGLLYKCYIAMVAESARGYTLNMRGTEALVRMMMAAGKKWGGGGKKKPGWGPLAKESDLAKQEGPPDAENQ